MIIGGDKRTKQQKVKDYLYACLRPEAKLALEVMMDTPALYRQIGDVITCITDGTSVQAEITIHKGTIL